MPTAALGVVGFEAGHWTELRFGTGRLLSLYVPKAR
jgi:hypothetical protein